MHKQTAPSADATHSAYVPAIDGLRFFAVGSVLIYHLWGPLLPGGFVGVDVFFVISGYLITGQLIGPHAPSLTQFYQNRIARIAPASLLTVAVTLAASAVIMDGQHLAYLGTAAATAALSVINVKLIFQQGYFADVGPTQPLLHFWSLAVEEQFYLIYPALLLALRRFNLSRVLAIGAAISLGLCLWLTQTHPTWAFFLLPARAWELAAGGWLAVHGRAGRHAKALGWTGLALLILSFTVVREPGFPGWQALLPVAATMLLLNATRASGGVTGLLRLPPLAWVGLRSYSLYLWHWPVYVLTDYALFSSHWGVRLAIKAIFTLGLAVASYEWVERPLRRRLRGRGARGLAFGGFALAVAALVGAGMLARTTGYLSAEGKRLAAGGFAYAGPNATRLAFVGDSQAAMYATAMRDTAARQGWPLRLLGAAGMSQLPGEPGTGWPEVERWLEADRPRIVVMAEHWSTKLGKGEGLETALATTARIGATTIILLQPPQPDGWRAFDPFRSRAPAIPQEHGDARPVANELVRQIATRHPGVTVIDPAPLFLDPQCRIVLWKAGQRLNYNDGYHLSRHGADQVMPLVIAAINRREAGAASTPPLPTACR